MLGALLAARCQRFWRLLFPHSIHLEKTITDGGGRVTDAERFLAMLTDPSCAAEVLTSRLDKILEIASELGIELTPSADTKKESEKP